MLASRAIRYFEEVARRGSIRRASEYLNIAASAVDRQIIQLEAHLGVPLFDRQPKGLALTAAGEVLVEAARRSKQTLNEAARQIDDLQGLRRGEILIAAIEGTHGIVSRVIAGFQRDYPNIRHRLHIADARQIADLVITNEFDIGLTFATPPFQARIEKQTLYQFCAIVRAGHPLADRDAVSIDECEEYPLLVPAEPLSLRIPIEGVWAKNTGRPINASVESDNLSLLKTMIVTTGGVGLLTPVDVIDEVRNGILVTVPLREDVPMSVLSLLTSSGRTLSKGASELIRRMGDEMTLQDAPSI